MLIKNKKAQEEMVGFVVIVGIVAVIILFLLVLYLKNSDVEVSESYEAESFVQAILHYNTGCEDYFGGLPIEKLIFKCNSDASCLNGENSCEVLNLTLKGILDESWQVGEDRPVKGYNMKIFSNSEEILLLEKGNITGNYKGTVQDIAKGSTLMQIIFRVYY